MAIKSRPKGSISELLNIPASQISEMSERELRGIVSKLNDAANKRIKRVQNAGLAETTPQVKESPRFSLPKARTKEAVLAAYSKAKSFLNRGSGTTTKEAKEHKEKIDAALKAVKDKALLDPNNLDKRYKEPRLKKTAEKKIVADFWDEYHKFKELQSNRKGKEKGTTNEEDVSIFYDEYYSKGETQLSDYDKGATKSYEEQEKERLLNEIDALANDDFEEVLESGSQKTSVPAPTPKRGGAGKPKQNKPKKERVKQQIKSIKTF